MHENKCNVFSNNFADDSLNIGNEFKILHVKSGPINI